MKQQAINLKRILFLLGMMVSVFTSSHMKALGYAGIIILVLCTIFTAKQIQIDKFFQFSMMCLLFMVLRLVIQVFQGKIYGDSLRKFLLQASLFLFIVLIRNTKMLLEDWRGVFFGFAVYLLIWGGYLFVTHQLEYSALFGTLFGNFTLVGFGLCMILINLYERKRMKAFIILMMAAFLLMSFFSGMRSALIAEVFGLAYMIFTSLRQVGKKFNVFIFVLIMALCFLIPYIYLELYNPSFEFTRQFSSWLQRMVLKITGDRLFSGRDNMWLSVIPILRKHQLIGMGIGYSPSSITGSSLSVHNLFIFLRMEQGFCGLILFIALLFNVWNDYFKQERNKTKYAAQGFLLAIMIQQTFSLGLVGGKGAYSFIAWLVLVSLTKKEGEKDDSEKVSTALQ